MGGGCPCFEGYFYNIDKYEHKILNIFIIFVFKKICQTTWLERLDREGGGVGGGIWWYPKPLQKLLNSKVKTVYLLDIFPQPEWGSSGSEHVNS